MDGTENGVVKLLFKTPILKPYFSLLCPLTEPNFFLNFKVIHNFIINNHTWEAATISTHFKELQKAISYTTYKEGLDLSSR